MTTLLPPHPEVVRYLRALTVMTKDLDPDNRAFARGAIRDMAEPGVYVTDYMRPLMTRPLSDLLGAERRLRLLATASSADRIQSQLAHQEMHL